MESNFELNFICSKRPDMEFSSPKWCSSTVGSSLLERATLWVVFLNEEPQGLPEGSHRGNPGWLAEAKPQLQIHLRLFTYLFSSRSVLAPAFWMSFCPLFRSLPRLFFFASHQNGAQRHDRRCTSLIGSCLPNSSVMFGFMFQS